MYTITKESYEQRRSLGLPPIHKERLVIRDDHGDVFGYVPMGSWTEQELNELTEHLNTFYSKE